MIQTLENAGICGKLCEVVGVVPGVDDGAVGDESESDAAERAGDADGEV